MTQRYLSNAGFLQTLANTLQITVILDAIHSASNN